MNWKEECRTCHSATLDLRKRDGFATEEIPLIIAVYLNGKSVPNIFSFTFTQAEKYRKMKAFSLALRNIQAVAAVSTMDARMLQIQPFAEHFGLSTKNIETFQDEYSRILNGQFKGTMGNLPKDLYSDTIWTFIKGPHVPPFACCTLYSAGPNDQVIFQPTKEFDESHGIMESNLLSDWWNPTVN